jgi:hypothetical protein
LPTTTSESPLTAACIPSMEGDGGLKMELFKMEGDEKLLPNQLRMKQMFVIKRSTLLSGPFFFAQTHPNA